MSKPKVTTKATNDKSIAVPATQTFYKVSQNLMQVMTQQILKSKIVLEEGIQLINAIKNLEVITE